MTTNVVPIKAGKPAAGGDLEYLMRVYRRAVADKRDFDRRYPDENDQRDYYADVVHQLNELALGRIRRLAADTDPDIEINEERVLAELVRQEDQRLHEQR